jgi:hypothetical protein
MDIGSDDKVKLYAVIGLVVVAGIIAYFRFFNKPAKSRPAPGQETSQVAYEIPALPDWLARDETVAARVRPAYAPPVRDIFTPAPDPKVDPEPEPEPEPEPPGPPKLTAVMMQGQEALAVISGQIVRKGEKIDDYTVLAIGRRRAVLEKGGVRIVLSMDE